MERYLRVRPCPTRKKAKLKKTWWYFFCLSFSDAACWLFRSSAFQGSGQAPPIFNIQVCFCPLILEPNKEVTIKSPPYFILIVKAKQVRLTNPTLSTEKSICFEKIWIGQSPVGSAVKLAQDQSQVSESHGLESRGSEDTFWPNEQIFLHPASLSITEDADDQQSGYERRRKHFGRTQVKLIKLQHRIIFFTFHIR